MSNSVREVSLPKYTFDVPLKIEVGYKINGLSAINMSESTFEIDIKVFLFWNDKYAIGKPKGVSLNLKAENLLDPEIVATNGHRLEIISHETRVINSGTGDIKSTIHFRGTAFIRAMDLRLFPFDCQNLQLCLRSTSLPADKLRLVARPEETALEHQDFQEWNILGHMMKDFLTDRAHSSVGHEYSTMFITVLAQRQSGWFINNIFIISGGLLVFAWTTFLLEPTERGDKVDLIVNTIVASIANKFVVGDELPKVPYHTLVDMFVDVAFMQLLFTMICGFIVYFVYEHHGEEMSWLVNWGLLGLNALIFSTVIIRVWSETRSVDQDIELWKKFHIERDEEDWVDQRVHSRIKQRQSHFLDLGGVGKANSHFKASMKPKSASSLAPGGSESSRGVMVSRSRSQRKILPVDSADNFTNPEAMLSPKQSGRSGVDPKDATSSDSPLAVPGDSTTAGKSSARKIDVYEPVSASDPNDTGRSSVNAAGVTKGNRSVTFGDDEANVMTFV